MKKYTIEEFADQIRSKYPNAYDDLDDEALIQLWLKKFPEDKIKIIKKSMWGKYKYLYLFIFLLSIFVAYGIFLEMNYPNTEAELQNQICDKKWDLKEGEIVEIFINNVLIPRNSSNLRNNLISLIDSAEELKQHTNNELYDFFETEINSQKNKDSYIIFKKNGGLCGDEFDYSYYNQYYDSENSDLIFSESCVKLEKSDIGIFHFISRENQEISEYYLNKNESIGNSLVRSYVVNSSSIEIELVNNEKLDLIVTTTIVDEENQELKVVQKLSHEISYDTRKNRN